MAVNGVVKSVRLHIEMVATQVFRKCIGLYSLLKSEQLCTTIKLTTDKALARSVITYACLAWEFSVDTQLMKLQRLENEVLSIRGKFPRSTLIRSMHMAS
jgi:hypothetical protein